MKFFCTSLFLSLGILLSAQSVHQNYSKVKIDLTNKTIEELGRVGVEVDHGHYAAHRFLVNVYSSYELDLMEEAGFEFEVLIEDMEAEFLARSQEGGSIETRDDGCGEDDGSSYAIPENFELGTMAGFYTYEEMLGNLDAMLAQYPDLITAKTPIDGIQTIEGRPIYWLRISDNPNMDEAEEPEVFYNAVHHAREPNSMSQLIYFMWYILENYDNNPEIQFLIDNTEMYFMPCINPDGYIYNETTNPDGGGLWRKNRRLNADGSYGVDLNRNYDYEWGHDNSGSSPNPGSQVYRGTEGFSEPETQAVRKFCNDHDFQIALNYHTYGNLLIYPWGYSDTPTEDATTFNAFANLMTAENNYLAGTGSETVGYVVNGGSDDWMYGETISKPSIFSMTPEVGQPGSGGGFWPITEDIIPNCQATMWMNLTAANLLHNYGLATDTDAFLINDLQGAFSYSLKRYGLRDGSLTVSILPVSDNIISIGMPETYNLAPYATAESSIDYELNPDIQVGEEIIYLLAVNNGEFNHVDTITKRYGMSAMLVEDPADNLDNWTTNIGTWSTTTEDYYSATSSITDSPNAFYEPNTFSQINYQGFIPITNAADVKLFFWSKWIIEEGFDFVQLYLQVNEGDPFPVCGRYTTIGTEFQDEGNPVWDGFQFNWVEEAIDLTPYVSEGDSINFFFTLISDSFSEGDGFYFDDLRVTQLEGEVVNTIAQPEASNFMLSQNRPNPATTYTTIDLDLEQVDFQKGNLQIYNALGQLVLEKPVVKGGLETVQLNTEKWQSGVYSYRLVLDGEVYGVKRMEVY